MEDAVAEWYETNENERIPQDPRFASLPGQSLKKLNIFSNKKVTVICFPKNRTKHCVPRQVYKQKLLQLSFYDSNGQASLITCLLYKGLEPSDTSSYTSDPDYTDKRG